MNITGLRNQGERGFGVVEVVIAVLLLMTVASAIALATIGGNKLRGVARLQVAMTAAGKGMVEDISGNRGWMAGCQAIDRPCDVRSFVGEDAKELDDVDGAVTVESATATPLDSEVDGIMPNDRDGLVPDYYRLDIRFQPTADLARRYGTSPATASRTVVTTIDRRGDQAFGSLAIELCHVTNQADERMSVQGCANAGVSAIQEAPCSGGVQPCTSVFSWVAGRPAVERDPSPFVMLRRIPANRFGIRLTHEAADWQADLGDAKVGADGRLLFENVPAGSVRITGIPSTAGGNTERWQSKELPAFLGSELTEGSPVIVDPGVRARAMAVYRQGLTPRGVDLFFNRVTTTHGLTGPKPGHNIVVAPWAPTHEYVGQSAADECRFYSVLFDIFGGGGTSVLDCQGVEYGVPERNCATVYVRGYHYYSSSSGNWWVMSGEGGAAYHWYPAGSGPQDEEWWTDEMSGWWTGPLARQYYSKVRSVEACTEFWQEYHTTYYSRSSTTERTRDGIVHPINYSTRPMPDHRHVHKVGDAYQDVVPQCWIPNRWGQCRTDVIGLKTLVPGLNTGLRATFGETTRPPVVPTDGGGTRTITVNEADAVNQERGVSPRAAWETIRSDATWVRPNGDVVGSNGGTVAAGTRITVTGKGECYWTSPRFSGEREGNCNPCNPLWEAGRTAPGVSCSLLTKTCWTRHAREVVKHFSFPHSQHQNTIINPLPQQGACVSHDPPMLCRNDPPVVVGGCREWESAPATVPTTRHRTQSGAVGIVRGHAVNTPPRG